MRKELRKNSDGTYYYSFLYYDQNLKKNVRLTKSYIRKRFGRDLKTDDEAEEILKILRAENNTTRMEIERRNLWEKEFYDFTFLLKEYSAWQKKKAPNSFENNIHDMKHYVLHYFLNIIRCNSLAEWPNFFESFRDWLEKDAKLMKNQGKIISYGSKNHCVRALNTFMRHLFQRRVIDRLILCEGFPEHKVGHRTLDDIISIEEMERIYSWLKKEDFQKEATFFRFLYFTGMRFNEALGVSIDDVFEGQIEQKVLKDKLSLHGIEYHGYVVLSSQPSSRNRSLRDVSGAIKRKPLKGKKTCGEKDTRTVLVTDKVAWGEVSELYNHGVEAFERKEWSNSPKDYALFDGIDKSTATRRLKEAFKSCGLRYRSWHCCRHSCATNLIGQTGDHQLVMLWLGHSSPRVLNRYNHIYEMLVRSAKKREKGGKFRKFEVES